MAISPFTRWLLRIGTALTLAFIYLPLVVIGIYAFNERRNQRWPIEDWTTSWFGKAFDNPGVRDASPPRSRRRSAPRRSRWCSARSPRSRWRATSSSGARRSRSSLILPLALPGIVTGMALNATFREVLSPFGVELGLFTVIVGHATFCIVVVYNNVVARLRRTSRSLEEASRTWARAPGRRSGTSRSPRCRSALVAGALLAFALSFDEVIVTTFTAGAQQTLPIWILTNLSRPNQLPIVNVVALLVILLSAIPVYFAQRLTEGAAAGTGRGAAPAVPAP